jgi:hypothetical protein
MKATIKATAPTHYQLGGLRSFGLEVKTNGNGSYSINQSFETMALAKEYLTMRANYYFENASDLKKALHEIKNYHSLTIDSIRATIEKCE